MHVLKYLSDPKCEKKPEDSVFADYRLLCSGTLYRDILGDWSKSEVARILLDKPLLLFAASRPFEDHPLELVLHISVPEVQDAEGDFTSHYHPDDEVSRDLAALLSILCRRLITVAGKASQRHTTDLHRHPLFVDGAPMPLPVANSMKRVFWPSHPSAVITKKHTQEIQDYNPWPKPINAAKLTNLLLKLPQLSHSQSIVASSRLYALALELIHERPDISYQLLISSVETIADAVFRSFQPSTDAQIKHQQPVFDLAISLGVQEDQAAQLAIEACKREYWVKRKFKKFLMENVNDSVWTDRDDLFPNALGMLHPQRDAFEKTLGSVYDARSKATHVGEPFPLTASHTGGPKIPAGFISVITRSQTAPDISIFPPVIWFERVVNSAITGFWERSLSTLEAQPTSPPGQLLPNDPQSGTRDSQE